jgi:hypothetical protein
MMKRFTKRARIWVKFADGTSESFTVPVQLVSRIAPVVAASYPAYTDAWVERGPTVVLDKGDRVDASFASDLRDEFGGGYTTGGCPVCGSYSLDFTRHPVQRETVARREAVAPC